jgi:hypothetical protein
MTALPSPGKASSSGEMTFPVDSRLGVVRAWELSGDPSVSIDFQGPAEIAVSQGLRFI